VRIVFFGSPQFAVPTLERLLASPHRVVAVITQPDRPRGRGHRMSEGPVKTLAVAHQVPVLQPDRLKTPEFLDRFRGLAPDLGIVAAYGKILPEEVLQVPPFGLLNVHASLLPRWRGAAPVERAVMAGDRQTGVTIMRVVRALDAGPLLASTTRAISPDETAEQVESDLSILGAELLARSVEDIAAARASETAQDDALATYAPRLTKEEGLIDWRQSAVAVHNKVRGLHPWPHAYTFLGHDRYIVLRTRPNASRSASAHEGAVGVRTPGTVLDAAGDRLVVAAGDGTIHIDEIQAEGRRAMAVRDFLAGCHLAPGSRFGVPDPA